MVRIICEEVNIGDAVHVDGAPVATEFKTFDVELPEIEAYLKGKSDWKYRRFIGVELFPKGLTPMTLYTDFESSLALKKAGVELPIEMGDRYFSGGLQCLASGKIVPLQEDYRRFTLDELMQLPEWAKMGMVIIMNPNGLVVNFWSDKKRRDSPHNDLQSALNKVATLIAQHRRMRECSYG